MSDNETLKTQSEYLRDVTSQLKEMRHYAQTNTETLSTHWLAFDAGEYKNAEFAAAINELLTQQGTVLETLEKTVQDLDIEANRIDNEA